MGSEADAAFLLRHQPLSPCGAQALQSWSQEVDRIETQPPHSCRSRRLRDLVRGLVLEYLSASMHCRKCRLVTPRQERPQGL